jgi:hypothetical protein
MRFERAVRDLVTLSIHGEKAKEISLLYKHRRAWPWVPLLFGHILPPKGSARKAEMTTRAMNTRGPKHSPFDIWRGENEILRLLPFMKVEASRITKKRG